MRRILVDHQLPVALARWIEGKGDFAEHVMALDLGQSSDLAFWERAATEGAVIIRKDEDFARLTLMRPERVSVLWLRIGNCRTAVLLATLGPIWLEMLGQFDAGARLVEVH